MKRPVQTAAEYGGYIVVSSDGTMSAERDGWLKSSQLSRAYIYSTIQEARLHSEESDTILPVRVNINID